MKRAKITQSLATQLISCCCAIQEGGRAGQDRKGQTAQKKDDGQGIGVLDWNRTSNWPLGGAGYIHLTTRTAYRILAEMRRNQNLAAGIMRALKKIAEGTSGKIVFRSCHLLH